MQRKKEKGERKNRHCCFPAKSAGRMTRAGGKEKKKEEDIREPAGSSINQREERKRKPRVFFFLFPLSRRK